MLRWSVLLVGGVLAVASAMPAAAAPLVPTQYPTRSASDGSDIVKVHGFHRSCRWGPRRGWWHRHVGPYGRPVHCGRYRYYRYYHGGPYWHGPGITFRFGHHRRFHHHRFHHRRWR
jgi:hypothetical protein